MWKNADKNVNHSISLHDCRATSMSVQEHALLFHFDDGFWVSPTDKRNPFGNIVRTDKSEIQLVRFEVSDIHIFKEVRVFHRMVSTKRVSFSLEKLMANINSGKWELEFVYEYHAHKGVLYQCWIWMKQPPYHMECQIVIDCEEIEYHWNNLCEDRTW